MVNHLKSMKIAWDNLVSVHIYVLCTKTSGWGGVINHLAERWRGTKTFFVQDGVKNFLHLCKIILCLGSQD